MYYPYLRAKQYELKALREFSAEHQGQNSIVPILEPVKQQPNALNLAIDEMLTNGLKFALILNPKDGDFKHPTVQFDTWFQNEKLLENKDILEKRNYIKKANRKWYEIWVPQQPENWKKTKLVLPLVNFILMLLEQFMRMKTKNVL